VPHAPLPQSTRPPCVQISTPLADLAPSLAPSALLAPDAAPGLAPELAPGLAAGPGLGPAPLAAPGAPAADSGTGRCYAQLITAR
jgi:hypothetical protein